MTRRVTAVPLNRAELLQCRRSTITAAGFSRHGMPPPRARTQLHHTAAAETRMPSHGMITNAIARYDKPKTATRHDTICRGLVTDLACSCHGLVSDLSPTSRNLLREIFTRVIFYFSGKMADSDDELFINCNKLLAHISRETACS